MSKPFTIIYGDLARGGAVQMQKDTPFTSEYDLASWFINMWMMDMLKIDGVEEFLEQVNPRFYKKYFVQGAAADSDSDESTTASNTSSVSIAPPPAPPAPSYTTPFGGGLGLGFINTSVPTLRPNPVVSVQPTVAAPAAAPVAKPAAAAPPSKEAEEDEGDADMKQSFANLGKTLRRKIHGKLIEAIENEDNLAEFMELLATGERHRYVCIAEDSATHVKYLMKIFNTGSMAY